jgi:hypothetical protein
MASNQVPQHVISEDGVGGVPSVLILNSSVLAGDYVNFFSSQHLRLDKDTS